MSPHATSSQEPTASRAAALHDRLRAALNQPSRVAPFPRAASVTENEDLAGLGGRWFDSPEGPGYVIESVYDAGHAHGSVVLHRALSLDMARIAPQARDERLATCDPSALVFVDTETTGLGGAGAMVFLAGVARFEGATLHLRQYLLPSPAFERGLLGGLAGELSSAGALVSYNGKSFDLPMLEARYILSRARPTFRQLPHLDLLHPNRRLFKGAVESHRLPNIERELLGFEREDDCPSAEVPERYFRFARTSDPTHILPVLRHNAWDILSLVALAAHLGAACDVEQFPLQASRAAGYAGDLESVVSFAEATLASSPGRAARIETIERAARACRRLGRDQEAARWWQRAIDEPRSRRLTPYIELAKLYEHRLHHPAAALATVEEAITLVQRGLLPQGNPNTEATLPALQRRRDRLHSRLSTSHTPHTP